MLPETIEIQAQTANLSDEQFFQLCIQNKEIRFERDKHKNIILMSPVISRTGGYHSDIMRLLLNWNYNSKLGKVFDSSSGFTLPNGAMRAADVSWITNKRWYKLTDEDKDRFAHICPDFIIEVRSKSDSLKQQQEKMDEWLENGCRLGWLIDIAGKKTYVYRPNKTVEIILFNKKLSGENVLPGLEMNLSEIVTP